ncbi:MULTISPECIES: ATP-binding protein [Rhodomicrobium]|uniref:ATP-binding protein n=1 Tax=Rhodomicrobium TaxID=1068 RepID=UPI000B4B47E3|nr:MULTISPECIES: ATP-binding protein [Rhodomicrobium]
MKRFLPRTVAGQLIAVGMLALVVSQIALMTIMLDERQSAMRRWWANYMLSRIASVVELLDQAPETMQNQVINAFDSRRLTFDISAEAPNPQPVMDENSIYLRELRGMIPKDPAKIIVDVGEAPSWMQLMEHWLASWRNMPMPEFDPWLEASVQLNNGKWLNLEVSHSLDPPPLALIVIPVMTMLVVFGSTLVIIIRHITRPMKGLAQAAEALGRGEDVPPVAPAGPAEIRQAIEAFNDMRERLSRFVLDRTKMLAAVGHDLRTPITSMRLRAEFIEDEEVRGRMLSSLDEMQHMAEAALAFAREEASLEPTRIVDLNALLLAVCTDQSDMERNVVYKDNGRMLYRCRPQSLKRAVRNLVENAVVHGNCARVHLNGPQREVWITVEDDGPGISEKDIQRVFSPFVRLDQSRGQETGGIGLGLAIARSIVRGHGGDIAIKNRPEGGLSATIQLPMNG